MHLTIREKIMLQRQLVKMLYEKFQRTKDAKVKLDLEVAKKELKQLERGK